MAPQICLKPWASRHSWKSWFLAAVIRSQQQRGKKFVVPSGSTWRRQISISALAERIGWGVFLFPTCIYLSLLDVVRVQILHRFVKLYELEFTCMGLTRIINLHSTSFRQIDSDKTLQVLQQRPREEQMEPRFAWSLEPFTAAGRVAFHVLFADPNRGVAKTAWCQVAQLEEGRFLPVPRREKWLRVFSSSTCIYLSLLDVVRVEICIDLVVVWVQVDLYGFKTRWIGYLHLSLSQRVFDRLFLTKHCRCFDTETKGADGAADLLEALSQSTPAGKSWFLTSVIRSQQGPGKKFVVPSGSTWRRQISISASQREMVEGFSCFLRLDIFDIFVLFEVVRIQKHCQNCEVVVWVGVDRDGFKMVWNVHEFCPRPDVFSTRLILTDKRLQVLHQKHGRSRWSRRFAWSLEPVDTAGRVIFCRLQSDPSSSVAKTSWWRLAKAAGGRGDPRGGGAAACSWPRGTGRPDWRGIRADMIRGKGEKRRISDDEEDNYCRYTAVWCEAGMFVHVHCFHCFALLVSVDWYDYFQVFLFLRWK